MTSQSQANTRSFFLSTVLRADGVFALTSAALTILGARPVSELIGLDSSVALVILGLVLLGYGGPLLFYANRPERRQVARLAILLNILWVAGSYAGLLLDLFPVNTSGKWAIALVAEAVFVFAVLEYLALRRSR
jgi:hypothetical protein